MNERKRVAVLLPGIAGSTSIAERYAVELEVLAPLAVELVPGKTRHRDDILEAARGADAILTSWGVALERAVIEQLDRCVVIAVGSIGVDMVDVEAATGAGIVVTNVPDVFIEEVADHTMMLLLAAARRVKEMNRVAAEGRWWEGRPVLSQIPRLLGQTLGLIAFGNVGRATARRARAFGLHVIACDPYISELEMTAEGVEPVTLAELLARSDYVSIHAPLNDETRHLLDASSLRRMKRGAVVINTSRGGTIDEPALIAALRDGTVAAAGLDVLEQEPPDPDNPLLHMPNVILTPHVASATSRMRPETRRRAAREVALTLSGRWPMSCVNPHVLPKVELVRWQPVSMHRGPNR
jgi:D-3-phosphoglycerate dehydrogenase